MQMFTIHSQHLTHTHTRCACVSFIRGLPCIGISLCVLLTHIPRVCMSTFPKAGLKGWKSFSPCGPCLHGQQRSTTSKSCQCRLEKRKTTKNPTQRSIARHRWAVPSSVAVWGGQCMRTGYFSARQARMGQKIWDKSQNLKTKLSRR